MTRTAVAPGQLDLLALVDEGTAGQCWRCRHNVRRSSDGRYCWCDLPIPYPPGEPLHNGDDVAHCWCGDLSEREMDATWAWADAWVAAQEAAA